MQISAHIINGLSIGAIYALVALGYTMVYGIAKLINFAHAEVVMVGAYISFVCFAQLQLPLWLTFILTMAFCACLGVIVEKTTYKPLRNSPKINLLITSISVGYIVSSIIRLIFSANPKTYPIVIDIPPLKIGGASISGVAQLTIGISVVIMTGLTLLIKNSKIGRAMRACSEDNASAMLMGVNLNRTIAVTFGIGSALGGIASILYSAAFTLINPYMGGALGLKAFVAAVLGGVGSIPGAMLGGFMLGVMESLTKAYISSQLANAIVYIALIVVLIFKPSGILGKNTREKV